MKIIGAILLSWLSFSLCFSQKEYASISVRVRNPQEAFGVADSNETAYVFEGHKQYHISILDSTGKDFQNFIVTKNNKRKKEDLIGATIHPEKFTAYFYNKSHHVFSSMVVDRLSGTSKYYDLTQLNSTEQFLRSFISEGKFYFLSVPKQKNILNVYASEGESISSSVYGIEMTTFYANLSSNNDQLNEAAESAVGIETIHNKLDNNLKSTYPKKKLYIEKNKFMMTFDEPNSTHLITVDLIASKASYKKLNFTLEKGNNASLKKGNSYLLNNKIFRTTISPEMMNVSIVDIDSFKLVNSYNSYPDKDIDISNGPILQEGGTLPIAMEEKVIYKTRQYFNRVLNGNIAIVANKLNRDTVEVEVGSYEEIITRGSNSFGMPGFGMGGIGFSIGGSFGPGMYYNPWGGFNPYNRSMFGGLPGLSPYSNVSTRIRIVSFKSLLMEGDYQHVNGEVPLTLRSKINAFIEKNFKNHNLELYSVTAIKDTGLLMGYYKKGTNRFEITFFEK